MVERGHHFIVLKVFADGAAQNHLCVIKNTLMASFIADLDKKMIYSLVGDAFAQDEVLVLNEAVTMTGRRRRRRRHTGERR